MDSRQDRILHDSVKLIVAHKSVCEEQPEPDATGVLVDDGNFALDLITTPQPWHGVSLIQSRCHVRVRDPLAFDAAVLGILHK